MVKCDCGYYGIGLCTLDNDCRVGKVYLFAGEATFPTGEQDAEAYAKVVFQGEDPFDRFGQGLASGGDINGDGTNDIVVGSRYHTETSKSGVGRVYVFLLPDYKTIGWPSNFDDKHWDGAEANIIIDGPTNDNNVWFGFALASDGNTNNGTGQGQDSRADLLVGAPRGNSCTYIPATLENDRGFAYLFRYTGSMDPGENGGHLTWAAIADSAAYYRIICNDAHRKYAPQLGRAIAFIGDADGDTENDDEFVIGCPGWDTTTYPDAADDRGGVYMIAH